MSITSHRRESFDGSEQSLPRISAIILPDGEIVEAGSGDSGHALRLPPDLIELTLGALRERITHSTFIWASSLGRAGTIEGASPLRTQASSFRGIWRVSISKVVEGSMPAARIEAEPYRFPPYGLSVREIELITLIAAGMTNGEIADALQLSARTVTTHLANIMGKLSVANRTEIAATAFTEGLLSLPLSIDDAKLRALDIARIFRSRGHRDLLPPGSTRTRPRSGLLTVGALVPREGRASPDAIEMVRGAQLAVEEINRRNGVHGRLVRLQTVDVDVDDLASVRHGVHSLLSSGVAAITSGYLRHQMDAMELSSAEGMPFLHSSASSSLERIAAGDRQRHQHVFQCCPTDTAYAPTFVRYMTKLRDDTDWSPQSNRLVIVQQRDWDFVDYGAREAEALAGQQGWDLQIIETKGSSEDTSVWARTATEAVGVTPAAIMLASYFVEEHMQFFTAVDQLRSRALRYAVYAPSLPEYRRRLGDACEGLLWATTTGTYSDDLGQSFAQKYQERFRTVPGRSHAGIAYDRINLLSDAWLRADDPWDFAEVAGRLNESRYRGVNGAYSFGTPGQGTLALQPEPGAAREQGILSADPSLAQAHTIFQIRDGHNLLVSPDLYAVSGFAVPDWAR